MEERDVAEELVQEGRRAVSGRGRAGRGCMNRLKLETEVHKERGEEGIKERINMFINVIK